MRPILLQRHWSTPIKSAAWKPIPTELDRSAGRPCGSPRRCASARTEAAAAKAELARLTAIASSTEAMIAPLKLEIVKLRRELYGPAVRAQGPAARAAGAAARGARGHRHRGRARGRAGRSPRQRWSAPGAPAPGRASRSRPICRASAWCRCPARPAALLRLGAAGQARRGRHRDAGGDPAPVEGDPDRAREVHLPRLRADQPAAGAVPSDPARLGRAEPAGHDPVREVRPASAAEPPERALCPRGRRAQPLDAGRPGRRLRRRAAAAPRADRGARAGRRAAAWRRHHRAGAGQGQDRHRPALDLCPRRPALRRRRAARRALPLLPRPARRASRGAISRAGAGILQADAYAGFNALYAAGPPPGADHRGAVLGHARRKFFELADIAATVRRGPKAPPISPLALEAVERIDAIFAIERTINGLPPTSGSPCARHSRTARRRARSLDARASGPVCPRHAEVAKAMDYMLTRWDGFTRFLAGRPRLPDEQRRRARAARHRPRPKVMALRRLGSRRRAGPPSCTP